MKKIFQIIIVLVCIIFVMGCNKTDNSKKIESSNNLSKKSTTNNKILEEKDFAVMYTNPDKYINSQITLNGKVFTTPEYDEKGVYFQMWGDPKNSSLNTIIKYNNPNFKVNIDDYVNVIGIIKGSFEAENAFGGKVTGPTIEATSLKIVNSKDVLAPTIHEKTFNTLSQNQHGCIVSVEKVEFAENETRIYLLAKNNSEANFNIYSFNMKLVQNAKQYKEIDNYEMNYQKLQSDLLPGIETRGVVTFTNINQENFKLVVEGSSDNWDLNIEPYIFDIKISD